jgi:hypothetical protein
MPMKLDDATRALGAKASHYRRCQALSIYRSDISTYQVLAEQIEAVLAELARLQRKVETLVERWPEATSGKVIVGYSDHYRKWITGWCGDPMFDTKAEAVLFVVARLDAEGGDGESGG